jgi:hypothetical protein
MWNDVADDVDRCWCDMIWLDVDVVTLHVKRIGLNNRVLSI